MLAFLRRNAIALLALFVALGGTGAYAANTVFSGDIVDGQVMNPDLANGAVTSAKILDGQVLWQDIGTAITRKDRTGKVWAPQERVDRPTALRMYTRWAADYVLKPELLGSIEKGKLADLVVLDKDYMTIPEDQIKEIQPQFTIFDGKIVFVHSNFAQEYNLRPQGAVVSTYKDLIARRQRRTSFGAGG